MYKITSESGKDLQEDVNNIINNCFSNKKHILLLAEDIKKTNDELKQIKEDIRRLNQDIGNLNTLLLKLQNDSLEKKTGIIEKLAGLFTQKKNITKVDIEI